MTIDTSPGAVTEGKLVPSFHKRCELGHAIRLVTQDCVASEYKEGGENIEKKKRK